MKEAFITAVIFVVTAVVAFTAFQLILQALA